MASIWTIRRSTADRKVTGLCGGIAAHWGIDPLLVRIGGVVLAVSGGIGLVLYLAGWLFVPEQGSDRSKLEELVGPKIHRVPRAAWIAIVVVGCLIATGIVGPLLPFGLGPALILAGIWYFGYYRGRGSGPSSPHTPPDPQHQAPPTADHAPPPYGTGPHGTTPYGTTPYGTPPYGTAPHGTGPHGTAPHGTGAHGTGPHGTGPDSPFAQAAEAWRQRVAEASATGPAESTGSSQPEHDRPPVPPTSRQPYSWTAPSTPRPAEPTDPVEPTGPATEFTPPPWAAAQAEAEGAARADYFRNPDPVGLYRPEPAVPVPVAPPRPGDRPSARRLRLIGLVALGLVLAGLGVADALGAPITATIYVAAALLVVGLTLVAGTWLGRARGVLPVGIVLAVALAVTSAAGQVGQVEEMARDSRVYATAAELPKDPITKDFGWLELDLSEIELERDTTLTAHVDVGAMRVTVPDNVNLNVRYQVDNGSVHVLDRREQSGPDLGDIIQAEARPDAPTLTLHLTIDQGSLEVTR